MNISKKNFQRLIFKRKTITKMKYLLKIYFYKIKLDF